jgi:hypothetical protein
MIVIIGRRTERKQLGSFVHFCSRCGRTAPQSFTRVSPWVTFLFIPVIPLGSTTYVRCGLCGFECSVIGAWADRLLAAQHALPSAPMPRG